MANEDGAAVLCAYVGADMELCTRPKGAAFGCEHAADLLGGGSFSRMRGGAFCWDAGAPGSDDWRVEHMVRPRDDARPGDLRIAFVFRAMKREYGCLFRSRWPYKCVSR